MLGPTEGVIRWDRPNEASAIDMLLTNLNTGSNTFLSELSLDSFTTDLIPSGTNFRVRARSICPIDFSDPHKAQVGAESTFSTPSVRESSTALLPFEVYPNPANSLIRFNWKSSESGILSIQDMMRRELRTFVLNDAGSTEIDLSDWPAGLYRYYWQPDSPELGIPASGSFVVIRD